MGSYLTTTNILSIVPGLPQTSTEAGFSNTSAIVDRHITRAEAYCNGKIALRYSIPFSSGSIPPLLITLCEDIAVFYSYRSFFTQDNQNYNDYLDTFKDAIATLDEIRDAKINLFLTDGSIIPELTSDDNADISSNVTSKQSFFDVDDPLDWAFNNDLKDTIRGKR
jgi:phage gp36-like protein